RGPARSAARRTARLHGAAGRAGQLAEPGAAGASGHPPRAARGADGEVVADHERQETRVTIRLSISVEAIDDQAIVAAVEAAVRASFDELALPGAWHVTVKPSHVGGRWDCCVAGLDVRHRLSISSPARQLAGLIPGRLI